MRFAGTGDGARSGWTRPRPQWRRWSTTSRPKSVGGPAMGREVVIPLNKVAAFGDEVRLVLSASELAGVDLYHAHALRPMPDHWSMPAGFDLRSFFLVVGDPWTASVLPFVLS